MTNHYGMDFGRGLGDSLTLKEKGEWSSGVRLPTVNLMCNMYGVVEDLMVRVKTEPLALQLMLNIQLFLANDDVTLKFNFSVSCLLFSINFNEYFCCTSNTHTFYYNYLGSNPIRTYFLHDKAVQFELR